MTFPDMEGLLKENLRNRPNSSIDYDSITTTKTKVAGHDGVLMAYRTAATPAHQGLECAFQSGRWLFYFAFSTVDDFRYEEDSRNFETILATFKVLD
jgi:hypothetical protein